MASATRRARRANKQNNMSNENTLNLDGIVTELNAAVTNLDRFAQAATKDNDDAILRARMTQALVLAGTAVELLGGLNAQAKAAEAAIASQSDSDIDTKEESENV